MSEWGNPTAISSDLCMEERTQGSETSQYLEEKKANQRTFFLVYTTRSNTCAIVTRKKVLAIP